MRSVASLLLVLSLWSQAHSQTSLEPEVVKKMVVFLFMGKTNGGVCAQISKGTPLRSEQVEACVDSDKGATGFLIAVPDKRSSVVKANEQGPISGLLLLVTARHVFEPTWANCPVANPDAIYLRLNKLKYDPKNDDTGVDYFRVALRNDKSTPLYWVRNDDEEVDAAVIDISFEGFSQDHDDFIPLRLSIFASLDEAQKLQIGDSISSAGLLPGKSGQKRNYPFFKFGAISNIPSEPVTTGCGLGRRLEKVWFVAANLAPGNSGSPIFYDIPLFCMVRPLIQCHRGLTRGAVIGLQSSSFGDPIMGSEDVAGMTPIDDVFKIIEKNVPPTFDLYRGDEASKPPVP
ncbi:MAG: trypsin-like peptidase domain-containing protein [Candidatus Sulfotelmatobacter sp.]